jgi:hypothetical protein
MDTLWLLIRDGRSCDFLSCESAKAFHGRLLLQAVGLGLDDQTDSTAEVPRCAVDHPDMSDRLDFDLVACSVRATLPMSLFLTDPPPITRSEDRDNRQQLPRKLSALDSGDRAQLPADLGQTFLHSKVSFSTVRIPFDIGRRIEARSTFSERRWMTG